MSRAPLLLSGAIALLGGCGDVQPPQQATLLQWAESLAGELQRDDAVDWLSGQLLDDFSPECGAPAATREEALPEWAPSSVSDVPCNPELSLGAPPLTVETFGACSNAASDRSGTLELGWTRAGDLGSPGCSWDLRQLSGLPAERSPGALVLFDGTIYTSQSGRLAQGGGTLRIEDQVRGCFASVQVEDGAVSPTLLGAGSTTVAVQWSAQVEETPVSITPVRSALLVGSVDWAGPEGRQTFVSDLRWESQDADPGFSEARGCAIEPDGTLELSWQSPEEDAPSVVLLATFDGSTACDGCASLTRDGEDAGDWCPETGFRTATP